MVYWNGETGVVGYLRGCVTVWERRCAAVCCHVPPAVFGAGGREQCFFTSGKEGKEQPPALRHSAFLSLPGN